jgi:hypothetical protein
VSRAKLITLSALLLCLTASFAQDSAAVPDNPYVRHPRKTAISGEVGANSLASLFGVDFTSYLGPQFALDAGLGVSVNGLRPGIRARYNFTMAKLTPFVAGGLKYGAGLKGGKFRFKHDGITEEHQVEGKASPFLDVAVGFDYLAHNGFLMLGTLGYSALLRDKNYSIQDGNTVSQAYVDFLNLAFGSGIGISLSFGKAF